MGPGCPSTDDACHADVLIRQDICIKLRDTVRQLDILLGCVHINGKEQLDYITVCVHAVCQRKLTITKLSISDCLPHV
jgi:hypothetical protein